MLAEQVYTLCKHIPKGKVTTYKEIAKALNIKAYQAVGQALRKNPYAPHVPCHRVVSSTGNLHGFKGEREGKALEEKKMLLEQEGVQVEKDRVNLKKYLHTF
ncbi:MGMT family protein [Candidatus Woesearchaeota archaeon]|nr:MGMT family protein [Candidatus Woesearchaeota archaeon]